VTGHGCTSGAGLARRANPGTAEVEGTPAGVCLGAGPLVKTVALRSAGRQWLGRTLPDTAIRNGDRLPVAQPSAAAQVVCSGLTPGFAGLYEVNAVVPPGILTGDTAPVVLSVAGQTSPAVTMAVR